MEINQGENMSAINTVLTNEFVLRPPIMEDAPAVLEIMRACDIAVIGKANNDLDDLLNDWRMPGFSLENDVCVIVAPDSRIVSYGVVMDNVRPTTPDIDLYIHPDYWHDDTPMENALIDWAETRSRQAVSRTPADARIAMHAYTFSQDAFYKTMLERGGMTIIRHAFMMKIDLDKATASPVLPEGITVHTFREGDDKRPVLEAIRDAWRDHWGYVESPFDEHYQRFLHGWEDLDPSLWFLAMDGNHVAAACLCQGHHGDDQTMGWVSTLGVTRAYRRRGLAMALLLRAFDEFRRRGKKSVGLGVDASSLTGATKLYEKAGMHIAERIDVYEKELRPGVVYGTQSVE
jgi:mycothiol synthase